MSGLIPGLSSDGVVTINRVVLREGYTIDDLEERVAMLCENVKTYHSETGFLGGMVVLNSGQVSNEGSTVGQAVNSPLQDREALIITFWESFAQHEASHRSETFQPLFQQVLESVRKRKRGNRVSHAVVGQGLLAGRSGGSEGCEGALRESRVAGGS
jgi:predicted DNA-binding protein (UPF0251 family)